MRGLVSASSASSVNHSFHFDGKIFARQQTPPSVTMVLKEAAGVVRVALDPFE